MRVARPARKPPPPARTRHTAAGRPGQPRLHPQGARQLWVRDITEHPAPEGKVYGAVVPDTFSGRVIGWSIDTSPTAALATNALAMAISNRQAQGAAPSSTATTGAAGSRALTERAPASGLVPLHGVLLPPRLLRLSDKGHGTSRGFTT
ncbi:DDE-type integrase/transposase/recombinase [Streptomyces sp. NPDC001155]